VEINSAYIYTNIDPSPTQTSEVNVVHSTSSQQPGGKKKNKGKSKQQQMVAKILPLYKGETQVIPTMGMLPQVSLRFLCVRRWLV
jgi:hypothetical protein